MDLARSKPVELSGRTLVLLSGRTIFIYIPVFMRPFFTVRGKTLSSFRLNFTGDSPKSGGGAG